MKESGGRAKIFSSLAQGMSIDLSPGKDSPLNKRAAVNERNPDMFRWDISFAGAADGPASFSP
jgi:hypothetical protein